MAEIKVGQRFGKYTVVKQVDKPSYLKNKGTYWLCRCDCGNETIMATGTINRNHSLSCGKCRCSNYDLSGEYGVGYTLKGEKFYFDTEDKIVVDHINHRKYDNRKFNLRTASRSQNNMNVGLKSNNTSGVTGVRWNKNRNKWESYIVINKKYIYLGLFKEFEDAVKARRKAEEKYFGEYAYKKG